MRYEVNTFKEYLEQLPEDRVNVIIKIRDIIANNLPQGFEEVFLDGFLQFVVPLKTYPAGYHNNPLPFISIASQKHFIALYHLGLYAFDDIKKWFIDEYPHNSKTKLDMGKSCIRFKNINQVPYKLIAELSQKISVAMWIEKYESLQKN